MRNNIYWMMQANPSAYFKNIPSLTHTEENYLNQMLQYKRALLRGWVLAAAILVGITMIFSMGKMTLALILATYFFWYQETKQLFYTKFTEIDLMNSIIKKAENKKL